MIENAQKPFNYNAEEDDEVLIVSDTQMEPMVWSVLNKAARSLGIEPTIVLMSEREYSYAEPTAPVAKAMTESDLVVLATSKGLAHSDAVGRIIEDGKKVVLMSEMIPETLLSGAATADYDEILELGLKIEERMNSGERIEITGPNGTDLVANISGQHGAVKAARCDVKRNGDAIEAHEARIAAFPDGEVPITPIPGTAEGTVVWDTTMHEIGLIDEPIRAEVEEGFVTEITGGHEAEKLSNFLAGFDNKNVYNIGELSVNINPSAEITGRLREDKKALGYFHIAVGAGGSVEAPVHIDGVLAAGTIKIDGEPIVEDGKITI